MKEAKPQPGLTVPSLGDLLVGLLSRVICCLE